MHLRMGGGGGDQSVVPPVGSTGCRKTDSGILLPLADLRFSFALLRYDRARAAT